MAETIFTAFRRHRKIALLIACSLALSGILFLPLFWGIPMGFDLPIHLSILDQFSNEIREGNLFPAWLGRFNGGLGDPTMVFYPPGLYYLGSLFSTALGWDTVGGLFGALFLLTAVCFVGMFFLVRPVGGTGGGLLAMACLLLIPFRAFVIHGAGMYPAYGAGCILPFALLALWRLSTAEKGSPFLHPACLGWACSLAMITLLNLPFAVLLLHVVILWALVEVGISRDPGFLIRLGLGTLWGLLLAAFYLVPMIENLAFIRPPFFGIDVYQQNFPLTMPPEIFGSRVTTLISRMFLFSLLGLFVSIAILRAVLSPSQGQPAVKEDVKSWVRTHLVFAMGAFFLLSPAARWLWDALPLLQKVNLPWRLLDHAAAPTAALQALAFTIVWKKIRLRPRRWILIALLSLASAGLCGNLASKIASANRIVSRGWLMGMLSSFQVMKGDYLPIWAAREGECGEGHNVRVLEGEAKGKIRHWGGSNREIEIEVASSALLAIHTFDYPGWEAEFQTGEEKILLPIQKDVPCGRMIVSVPEGSGVLRLRFGRPTGWRAGAWASGVAVISLGLWAVLRPGRSRNRQRPPRPLAPAHH